MHLKDYYDILEVETSASIPEIKRSFRKLAQQFHPDKNQSNPYAAAQFHEIKEAYEVLTNPAKKEYYLQQRWFEQSIAKKKKQALITPFNILKQSLELEKYVSTLDVFRMDKQGLEFYILEMLSNETVDQLKKFDEADTTTQIAITILKAIEPLPLKYTKSVIQQLSRLTADNALANQQIEAYSSKANRRFLREKYFLLFIISITFILCLLILLAAG